MSELGTMPIECVSCDDVFRGTAEEARAAHWRHGTISDAGVGWTCSYCRANDEEQPDGFPNPGAGFCRGLGTGDRVR